MNTRNEREVMGGGAQEKSPLRAHERAVVSNPAGRLGADGMRGREGVVTCVHEDGDVTVRLPVYGDIRFEPGEVERATMRFRYGDKVLTNDGRTLYVMRALDGDIVLAPTMENITTRFESARAVDLTLVEVGGSSAPVDPPREEILVARIPRSECACETCEGARVIDVEVRKIAPVKVLPHITVNERFIVEVFIRGVSSGRIEVTDAAMAKDVARGLLASGIAVVNRERERAANTMIGDDVEVELESVGVGGVHEAPVREALAGVDLHVLGAALSKWGKQHVDTKRKAADLIREAEAIVLEHIPLASRHAIVLKSGMFPGGRMLVALKPASAKGGDA